MKRKLYIAAFLLCMMFFLSSCNQNSETPEGISITQDGSGAGADTQTESPASTATPAPLTTLEKFFKNGPVCVRAPNELWGYIDINGNYVIEPKYQYASKFSSNGMAVVQDPVTGLYGYIDTSAQYIIEPQFIVAYPFSQDVALVKDSYLSVKYIDISGQCVLEVPGCDDGTSFSKDRAFVHNSAADMEVTEWAMIDINGNFLTDYIFYIPTTGATVNWTDDLCFMQTFFGEEYICINTQGETVAPKDGDRFNRARYFSDGLASVQDSESMLWGYIGTNGEWVIPPQFADVQSVFRDGYAWAREQSGFYGLIDKEANWILPPVYERMEFGWGKIIVYDGERYKLIDMSGDVLEEYDFEADSQISLFSNVLRVRSYNNEKGGYNFYQLDGRPLIDTTFSDFKTASYSDSGLSYAVVKIDGFYGVIDGTGDWLIPANYLDIKL